MQGWIVDDILQAVIVLGLGLSVLNLVVSVLDARSNELARVQASSKLRELYERTYRRKSPSPSLTRRLAAIARPGIGDRRRVPATRDPESREATWRNSDPLVPATTNTPEITNAPETANGSLEGKNFVRNTEDLPPAGGSN